MMADAGVTTAVPSSVAMHATTMDKTYFLKGDSKNGDLTVMAEYSAVQSLWVPASVGYLVACPRCYAIPSCPHLSAPITYVLWIANIYLFAVKDNAKAKASSLLRLSGVQSCARSHCRTSPVNAIARAWDHSVIRRLFRRSAGGEMIEFGVLGPVEARRAGVSVELPQGMPLNLLALLLIRRGSPLTTDALADALWDGHPPRTARKFLQVCVHRLRAALGSDVIGHSQGGYVLMEESSGLDSQRFETLTARARSIWADGDLPGASVQLQNARQLWRGEPYAGISDMPFVELERRRLAELDMDAFEDQIEVDLELGRHGQSIQVLIQATARHPYRERLTGQLMLALYRAGRQAEALETYRNAREALANDLGIDPTPALDLLHKRILQGDSLLSAPVSAASQQPPSMFLPHDIPDFTGRHAYLQQLDSLTDSTHRTTSVVISATGMGGVGKSALAVHWAYRKGRMRYPDGQLYVNLRGYGPGQPMEPIEALSHMLACLGLRPEQIPVDLDKASALYRAKLDSRKFLVLLDNARTVDQVRPLLPGGHGSLALVTSRDLLSGLISIDGARRIPIDVLSLGEAQQLLEEIVGRQRVAGEPEQSQQLIEMCARLPLALRIAATHLADQPDQRISDYVSMLRLRNQVTALTVEGDERNALRAIFDSSLASLPPDARQALTLIGAAPVNDYTVASVAALIGEPGNAKSILDNLAAASLLTETSPGRYDIHDLIRQYAAGLAKNADAPQRLAAVQRFLDYYLSKVTSAAHIVYPGLPGLSPSDTSGSTLHTDRAVASDWLNAELTNCMSIISYTATSGPRRYAWLIADGLRAYFRLNRRMSDWLKSAELAITAAEHEADLKALAAGHFSKANACQLIGEHTKATQHYELGQSLSEQHGWVLGTAVGIHGRGVVQYGQGDLDRAMSLYREAYDIAKEIDNQAFAGTVLNSLGLAHWDRGELSEAERKCRHALEIHRNTGAIVSQAFDLQAIALIVEFQGFLPSALVSYTEALNIFRDIGNLGGQATVHANLSALYAYMPDAAPGREHGLSALRLAREIGNKRNEGTSLGALARCSSAMGELSDAAAYVQQALTVVREVADRPGQVNALLTLAAIDMSGQRLTESFVAAQEALGLARTQSKLEILEARALITLAKLAIRDDDHEVAASHARAAIDILQRLGARLHLAEAQHTLAEALEDPLLLHQADKLFAQMGAAPGR